MLRKKVRRDFPSPASFARDEYLSKNPLFIPIQRGVIGISPICEIAKPQKKRF
jgi:hypothetical protein